MVEIVTADYLKSSTLLKAGYSLVQISRTAPLNLSKELFKCEELFPTWEMVDNKDKTELFEKLYYEQILLRVDVQQLMAKWEVLGDKIALLCWEPSHQFCHRHIVRKWLSRHGIKVVEFCRAKMNTVNYKGFGLFA